jgi:hypothetical protein
VADTSSGAAPPVSHRYFSCIGLLVRQDGARRIRIEDEDLAPAARASGN